MNIPFSELDNVWAVLAVLILLVADRFDRRRGLAKLGTEVGIVKTEVKNDHPDDTNLRDDLDHSIRIGEANARTNTRILDAIAKLGRDLGDVRTFIVELRTADRTHAANQDSFEKRVRDFIAREFPGAGPL